MHFLLFILHFVPFMCISFMSVFLFFYVLFAVCVNGPLWTDFQINGWTVSLQTEGTAAGKHSPARRVMSTPARSKPMSTDSLQRPSDVDRHATVPLASKETEILLGSRTTNGNLPPIGSGGGGGLGRKSRDHFTARSLDTLCCDPPAGEYQDIDGAARYS